MKEGISTWQSEFLKEGRMEEGGEVNSDSEPWAEGAQSATFPMASSSPRLPSPPRGLSYLGQVELPLWAGPVGQWGSAQGAEVAAGAGAEGWQGLQEGMSEAPCHPCSSPFWLGRDSHGRKELAPSHRDMVGLGQGGAGGGSR